MTRTDRFRCTLLIFVVAIAAGLVVTGAGVLAPQVNAQAPLVSIIVELRGDPVVVAKTRAHAVGQSFNDESHRQQVIAEQQQFLQRLTLAGVPYRISTVNAPNGPITPTIEFRYNYVFNGIALEVPAQSLQVLGQIQGVLAIHPNEPIAPSLDYAISYSGSPRLYGNPARLTGFDTLNTGGLEGEGIYIAVIDTGVDWSHEMFGGDPTPPQFGVAPPIAAAGPNPKVVYYLNLTAGAVGDDFGHGTHVAGDAAGYRGFAPGEDGIPGTADDVPVHGAAPQAKIMAYKVLSAVGSGAVASIVAGIEDAVQPRTITGQPKPVAHVINLSLGAEGGPDSAASIAADNAALAGAVVVASAGNAGLGTPENQAAGLGTIGQPAASRRAIAIAANNDEYCHQPAAAKRLTAG